MCGIVVHARSNGQVDPSLFLKRVETLSHRGPDGRGVVHLADRTVALGHRRLAIIDLSDDAAQPIANEDQSVWLVANGEIYNYRSLRTELERTGHSFSSGSDSEVAVHAYEEWGDSFVEKLRGIFALCLWDDRRKRLVAARDRLGVKPLYFSAQGGNLILASQPRAILADPSFPRSINMEAMQAFLACRYVPGELSIYAGIEKLPAAHILTWESGSCHTRRYWKLDYRPVITDHDEAVQLIRNGIIDAVRTELVSDVDVGVFLSGGIDSSTLCSIAAAELGTPPTTVTMGFDVADSDERPFARLAAAAVGAVNHEGVLTLDSALRLIPEFIDLYDEPFFDHSGLPTFAVSKLAHDHGLKVMLSGEGGDELFAGYTWHEELAKDPPLPSLKSRISRLVGRGSDAAPTDPVERYFALNGILDTQSQATLLRNAEPFDHLAAFRNDFDTTLPRLTAVRLLDVKRFLADDLLVKLDHASMAWGIEARVPLLDYRLVEAAFSIDESIIFKGGERKALMKKAVAGLVPDQILTARKKGFSAPLRQWMQTGLHDRAAAIVRDGSLVEQGVFSRSGVEDILSQHIPQRTWMLLVSELWSRRWLASEDLNDLFCGQQ